MIIAGFGFRTSASPDSLLNALKKAVEKSGYNLGDIQLFSAPSDKVNTEPFQSFIAQSQANTTSFPANAISGTQTLTNSERVKDMRGTGSVAEACALLAAGPQGELLGSRVVSDDRMATCALAKGDPS